MSLAEIGARSLDIVRQHQAWAGPICFVLAFAESLAFLSLLVPSTALLIAIGALVPLSNISFGEIWFGSAAGAALGDWLSYWIGYRFKDRIARAWPFSRRPDLIERTHRVFDRWGALGVFVGRFLGPLRATVPLVAGMGGMAVLPFQIANVTSAVVWAAVLFLPGAFGVAWLKGW